MSFTLFTLAIVLIIVLQIFLSKTRNELIGLIMPIIFILPSILAAFFVIPTMESFVGGMMIPIGVIIVIVLSSPSLILFLIYIAIKKLYA